MWQQYSNIMFSAPNNLRSFALQGVVSRGSVGGAHLSGRRHREDVGRQVARDGIYSVLCSIDVLYYGALQVAGD